MDILNKKQLQQMLITNWLGKEIIYKDTIGSTNDYAKQASANSAKQGLLVIADNQISGKGSRGRRWFSPPQTGIWMSFVLKSDLCMHQVPEITLMVSYCLAKVLRQTYQVPAMIKWPNDIILNGKKAAGILTETGIDKGKNQYIIIGIGINVNTMQFSDETKGSATSLFLESGHIFLRAKLAAKILKQIEKEYEKYLQANSLKNIYEAYNEILVHRDMKVKIVKGKKETEATTIGINEHGALLIRHVSGKMDNIKAGEISVRGIHGYI